MNLIGLSASLGGGNLYITCTYCGRASVIKRNVKCDECEMESLKYERKSKSENLLENIRKEKKQNPKQSLRNASYGIILYFVVFIPLFLLLLLDKYYLIFSHFLIFSASLKNNLIENVFSLSLFYLAFCGLWLINAKISYYSKPESKSLESARKNITQRFVRGASHLNREGVYLCNEHYQKKSKFGKFWFNDTELSDIIYYLLWMGLLVLA